MLYVLNVSRGTVVCEGLQMYLAPGARRELGDITPEDMRIKLPELASLESRGHVVLVGGPELSRAILTELVKMSDELSEPAVQSPAPEPVAAQEVIVPTPVLEVAQPEVLVIEVPQPKKPKSSPKSSK